MTSMRWLIPVVLLGGCKGEDKREGGTPAPAPAPAGSNAVAAGPGSGSAAVPPAPPAPPAPPTPKALMPTDVTPDKPVAVAALWDVFQLWKDGAEVQLVGYASFFIGDDDNLRTSLKLAAEPGQKEDKHVLVCDLAASEAGKHVDNRVPLTFKGKLAGVWDHAMYLKDCTLVAQGTPPKPDASPLPGSTSPAAIDKLVAAYMGWFGKELQVIGHANTVTVSRRLPKDGGAVIDVRLDMVKEIGDFKTVVGCHLASPPGPELDALKAKQGGSFVVKGTLKEITFGNPQLNPCTIVSQ